MPEDAYRPQTSPLTDFRFGAIAVWAGLVTQQQLEDALAEQEAARTRGEDAPRIGAMLVAGGVLTDEQVSRILRVQLQRLPDEGHLIYGQIAEASKLVRPEDVSRALDEQSRDMLTGVDVRRLGEILLEMGCISEEASRAVLTFQATQDPAPLAQVIGASHHDDPCSADAEGEAGKAFLPSGTAGVISDNIIWVVLGIAGVSALVLALLRNAIYG
jgi:hypothetical protein